MIIPLRTDAPIYHFPAATIGMIVANVVVFGATLGAAWSTMDSWAPFTLQYGQGLQPVQWVTSNFIHLGIFHLVGNMLFLWGFGLIVEGKLGWWKFLLVYFAIGIAQCATEQAIMEFAHVDDVSEAIAELEYTAEQLRLAAADGELTPEQEFALLQIEDMQSHVGVMPGSAGASAIIFGLMAIALVWAPKNELTCFAFVGHGFGIFDISILLFSCFQIGMEVLFTFLQDATMTSAVLHLMGAAAGAVVGVILLKSNVVDCEDWDLLSFMSGHYGLAARDKHGNRVTKQEKQKIADREKNKRQKQIEKLDPARNRFKKEKVAGPAQKIADLVLAEKFVTASDKLWEARFEGNLSLPEEWTKALIAGLLREKEWEHAAPLMEEYVEQHPKRAGGMQIQLAKVHLKQGEKPEAGEVLRAVDQSRLSDAEKQSFKKLVARIKGKAVPGGKSAAKRKAAES